MDGLDEQVRGLMLSGMCCTSVLVKLALEGAGHENPEFVDKVAPLCGGLWSGITCGALSGGLLALAVLNGERPADRMTVRHYVEWFRGEFGSTDCADLVDEDPVARALTCPPIVTAAYLKAQELAGAGD
jgi:hypothetical protein